MKRTAVVVVLLAAVLFLTSSMTQAPTRNSYSDTLAGLIGKKCSLHLGEGHTRLIFGPKDSDCEIVAVGNDFIHVTTPGEIRYLPLSRVETLFYK